MSTKIWAAHIDISLHRCASHLFREEEGGIISSSWKRKKRVIVQCTEKYELLQLICFFIKKTSYPHHVKPTVCLFDYAMSATTMTKGWYSFHYDGIEHTVGHRWDEGNITVRIDEDRRTPDWAPMRQKSSSLWTYPVYIRHGDDVVRFRQYKGHIMHFTRLHACNTLHKDTMSIMRSLIGSFLQTRYVDVINRTSFSHKALKIDKLINL
jgi:hypothetical protein